MVSTEAISQGDIRAKNAVVDNQLRVANRIGVGITPTAKLHILKNGLNNSNKSDTTGALFQNKSFPSSVTDTMKSAGIRFSTYSKRTFPTAQTHKIEFGIDVIGQTSGSGGQGKLVISGRTDSTGPYRPTLYIDNNSNITGMMNTDKTVTPYNPNASIFVNSKRLGGTSTLNLYLGQRALDSITSGGIQNTAIGDNALSKTLDGNNNTAVGVNAMANSTTTDYNTAVGGYSLYANTTGSQNSAFGFNALLANTTGQKNWAGGTAAMEENTTGSFCAFCGHDAGLHNSTGNENTGCGWLAMAQNRTGSNNCGFGSSSGRNFFNGNYNLFLGSESGYLDTAGINSQNDTVSNSMAIGPRSFTTASNQIWIGNGSHNDLRQEGIIRGTPSGGMMLVIDTATGANHKRIYYQPIPSGGGSSYSFTSPLSESAGTVSIANAAADGSTKGAASFTAADFNSSSGNISIDYANGQAASLSVPGFVTTGSQSFTGMKSFNGITMLFPVSTDGIVGTATEDRNVAVISTKNSNAGASSAMSIQLLNDGNKLLQIYNSSSGNGILADAAIIHYTGTGGMNFAATAGDFKWYSNVLSGRLLTLERSSGRLAFGEATSSYPSLVANSTNLSVMLGDGSAYTNIIAAGITSGSTTFNNANTNATTVNAFGAATTGNIFGTPTGSVTHNYSTNATASGNTKTVNIGTGGASSSTTNINIGTSNGGTVNFNSSVLYGNSNAYNDQTGTTYTLVAADNGKIVTISNASAITLTVPASLPAGFNCTIVQKGAGQITFTASSTTINNRQSFTKTKGQYSMVTIVQYTTNTFITQGDME